ncbi:MAG: DUF4386 family protein [Candidatus Heimdallarchaeota archaeon]
MTRLSGFLFLFILVLQIAMAAFGYILEPTPKHYESDAKLIKFNNYPKKFQLSVVLAVIEHCSVITLAITLFIVFSPYNIILGIILIIFRIIEGSIQVYSEKDYWRLLNIAKRYSYTIGTEKKSFIDSFRIILQTKSFRFAIAMISWSIGTLAFSIVLVIYGVVPLYIGWLGIVTSIFIGSFNGIKLAKPNSKIYEILSSVAGLSAILFEILIGGWLLFFS